ncbi:MAG: tetratricopeptide repeat protein, partial [Bacteroidetes bacterium]|nr:tetratricopeptide repeat protein [Bacteroidota bacterium]
YNMGVIHLINLKKYEIAITHFTNAIKVDPKYVEAYYGRGVSYQSLNDKRKALIDFQACQAINPGYEPAQIKLQQLDEKK